MKSLANISALQFGIVSATAIVCISHLGEFVFWGALVAGAVALVQYGLSQSPQPPSVEEVPSENQATESGLTVDQGTIAHEAIAEMFNDIWQTPTPMVVPVVTAVLDEQIEETGTIAESSVLDAEASKVEPMQPTAVKPPKDRAKAPSWGYKGKNIKPPVPSTNNLEIRMMSFRLQSVLPKKTKEGRRTWSELCKKMSIQGHTNVKDANPLGKALWLSERGKTFEDIVKASLELAAS
jgi:hypothetical protein